MTRGPLTIYVVDKILREAGIPPWSPEYQYGWIIHERDGIYPVEVRCRDRQGSVMAALTAAGLRVNLHAPGVTWVRR